MAGPKRWSFDEYYRRSGATIHTAVVVGPHTLP
jgi:hypothetical protein